MGASTRNRRLSGTASSLAAARNQLLVATAVSVVLYFIPLASLALYPIRLFVTFVHESGHALCAIVSGGSVVSLHVDLHNASGLTQTMTSPIWAWLVLSGGYLGSTVFGATLLQVGRLGKQRNSGKATLAGIAAFMVVATLLWAHNFVADPGTFVLGLALAALFGVTARLASPAAARFIVSFLAVQCCLNAFIDLGNLLFLTTYTTTDNDAKFMSQQYGLPPNVYAGLWSAVAIVVMLISLRGFFRPARGKSAPSLV